MFGDYLTVDPVGAVVALGATIFLKSLFNFVGPYSDAEVIKSE